MLSNDYPVKFVPVEYRLRQGKSKIRPLRDTANFLQLIVRVVMYFNPLRVFIPLSLLLLLAALPATEYDAAVAQRAIRDQHWFAAQRVVDDLVKIENPERISPSLAAGGVLVRLLHRTGHSASYEPTKPASVPDCTSHITAISVATEASVPISTTLEACSIQTPYWRAKT